MIALLILQATLGALPKQELPREGCAAYLWSLTEPRRLVAMAEPARLRLSVAGKETDLARTTAEGVAGLGLASTTTYAAGATQAVLTLTLVERADLTKGALAPEATLTLQQNGGDAVVTPVAGMVGCR